MTSESCAAVEPPPVSVRFMLDADAAPGLLCRVLQPFARRNVTPDRMWSHRNGDVVHVEVAVHALPPEMVHYLEGNLLQIVGVHRVTCLREDKIRQAAFAARALGGLAAGGLALAG